MFGWCLCDVGIMFRRYLDCVLGYIFSKSNTNNYSDPCVKNNKGYRMHHSELKLHLNSAFDRPVAAFTHGVQTYIVRNWCIYVYT